jgi:chromosome segregation ATPase
MKELIEKNPLYENISKLYEVISYFNTQNYKELVGKIKSEMEYKMLDNNIIDGDSLFGLLQNYIDFLNNGEQPVINSALENVLLSKAKNESDLILEEFKNNFNKKLEYPMSITAIYKIYFELLQKYTVKFCNKVKKCLDPSQTGEYLKKLFVDMEKELDTCLETNKDYYDEWFGMEYKELEEVLSKINLESINKTKLFILSFTSTIQTCLNKFLNIPNTDFCKNLLTILSKIFQNLVFEKLNNFGEKMDDLFQNYNKEYNVNIENLNNEIKKLNEQIENNQKLLNDKNKEKSESNRSFLELETKLDKLNREIKAKEKEYENNLNIEIQKYQKMETYYNAQIKEKDEKILNLESKIEKLNQDILGSNKESIMKANELNRENIKLQNQLEQLRKDSHDGTNISNNDENLSLQTLFKNIQNTFMEFKESIDKLDKENENVFKTKHLENSTKQIEGKININVNDIKNFFEVQIKTMTENYEKEIKKIKDEYDELNFELSKKKVDINEQTKLKEVCETKLKESVKQIGELNEISKSKDSLISTQNEALRMYEDKINDYKKMKEDLELSLAKNIYNFKMKEDEFDSLLMVIEGIVSRKKEKYEHNLNKLSPEIQTTLQSLLKQYKLFK